MLKLLEKVGVMNSFQTFFFNNHARGEIKLSGGGNFKN